jgi:hypothetical protein
MAKPKRERFLLRKRQLRRQKIKKLREKFARATSEAERQRIIEKIKRLSPLYPIEEVLGVKLDKQSSPQPQKQTQ